MTTMDNTTWKPSKKKCGVAICNYKGSGAKTLPLCVGEPVQIIEEYGSGSTAWFRGSSLKNKDREGVFPACLIHIKQCDVDRDGSHDIVTPKEDIMVREVGYVLHEWNAIWKDLYVRNGALFEKIRSSMEELIHLRALLVDKKLTEEDGRDIKSDIVSVIDWGNGQLDLDLVPRIDGEQVDAEFCSLTQLYRVHVNSAKIALAEKPIRKRRKTCKGEVALEAGLTTHHLLVSFRAFQCNVGDKTETLLSLYQNRDNKLVCFTEKFLVRHTRTMVPEDMDKLYNYYGLFSDLSTEEIDKDLYLVAHIYRIGSMKHGHKSPKVTFKRPWAVGVTALNLARLPANFKDYEYQMKVTDCHDNEETFASLHEQIIKKLTPAGSQVDNKGKQGPTLTVSLQILHGDLSTVKKEDPMLFSKGVAQIQKLGFTEDLSPVTFREHQMHGEVRNDLYVTLKSAELDRGSKKSQKNVEVKITVLNEAGKLIENCITYGCGEPPASEYHSSVHYHSNKPEWNETIRISVPIDIFPGSHLCFELFHCSVSNTQKENRYPYGFAFVRVTNEAQIVIKDDQHELCVYKCDEKHPVNKQQYFQLPFLLDDLNDPHKIPHIPNKLMFKANERESLTISTLLCSGKFTQNGDLLGILNWKGEQFSGKLAENLDKLIRMQGEEIVKFLHDIMDALFEMLMDDIQFKKYSNKIFQCMVNIFTLIHHVRFETFKPVLENYIADTFSATLVHKPLCDCFAELIDTACKDVRKTNTQLIQCFQVMDYIFRFVVQSRTLQRKDVYSRGSGDAAEFRENIHNVFVSMGTLLKATSNNLKGYQVELLHHLHLVYSPLMETLPDKDMAQFLQRTLEHMPDVTDVPEDITRAKIELLQRTIATKLFCSDESRALLLPFCLKEVKKCYEHKILMRVATDLLSDVMDCVFKMKQAYEKTRLIDVGTVSIKEDIQHIIQTIFDVVMETILHLRDTFATKDSFDDESEASVYKRSIKRQRKPPARSKTHTGFTMKNEAGLNRKQSPGLDALVLTLLTVNEGNEKPPKSPKSPRRKISDSSQNRSTVSLVEWMKSRGNMKEPEPDVNEEKQQARLSYDGTFDRRENRKSDVDITISVERPIECGSMIACLMEMLRLMEKDHYEALLHVYHRGRELHKFLMNIIEVFQVLVDPKVFSPDWTVMRMVTNHVMFTSMAEFSEALQNNFITGDKFDHSLWSSYFQLAVSFITQPSLQLDRYSEVKGLKLREKYQDMRVLMGVQVEELWYALGAHKAHFIPGMIGPFLELTLVPEVDVRKVTLPVIFDMIEWDQKKHGNFKQVEAALIERLDYFLTQKHTGDTQYKDLFKKILLERVHSEPALHENGTQFIISVTHLLERLLDYRQVVDGEENRDKRMHCTFNILNFYKDEINREEMYIKYVNKLHDLHMVAGNHAEAGLTLQLYAKILTWSDNLLPEEMKYKQERERDRKEMLYTQIVNCFDKGKVWEYALPLCKDLAEYYERNLDYKKLGDILKQQASFYGKILEGVPGEEQGEQTFYPRQDPSYYRVSYYGQSFPAFVRNKQFIYRGDECLKLATIMNHLTAEFPSAQIMSKNDPPTDDVMNGDQQYIQICSVKPIPQDRPEFHGKEVPAEIRNFYNYNEVDTFQYDRPYHRGTKDNNNESKTLCIERSKMKTTYKFPGILRWYEVTETEIEMLCPIRVAIDQLKQNNSELQILITRCQLNPKLFFSQLEMKLNGNIAASVQGGIAKYQEAFFTKEFEMRHPDEAIFLDQMKFLLHEQVKMLKTGMQIHGRLVPESLRPLHESLETEFKKMKKTVTELGSQYNSQVSLRSFGSERPSTPGSNSSSGRSSTYSQDEETSGVIHPGDLPFNLAAQCKSRRSYVPFPEEGSSGIPPPVPSRPHSMLLTTHGFSQMSPGLTNSKVKTGSDPLMGQNAGSPKIPTGRLSQSSLSKQRRDTICGTGGELMPPLPNRRRPSENPHTSDLDSPLSPTIPTFSLPNGDAPALPEKLRDSNKQKSTTKEVHTPPSRSERQVPPLPPRKGSTELSPNANIMRNGAEGIVRPSVLSVQGVARSDSNSSNSPVTIHKTINEEAAPPPIPRRTERKSPITSPKVLEFKDNHSTQF
ncbi:dedicator of cytokinesis protein 4-like isoform X4 [Ruditapes philippinarum]|uniref:dedicator of cytokinesis protein 4-like isoform X4 n=1 Tax=Ruditapes philippinarum TaxID=129788 RepID=UPI00295C0B96|nr:dedicator of cytokinesis protein 4-like isoform X4 [Ruditapes philippinarum]